MFSVRIVFAEFKAPENGNSGEVFLETDDGQTTSWNFTDKTDLIAQMRTETDMETFSGLMAMAVRTEVEGIPAADLDSSKNSLISSSLQKLWKFDPGSGQLSGLVTKQS